MSSLPGSYHAKQDPTRIEKRKSSFPIVSTLMVLILVIFVAGGSLYLFSIHHPFTSTPSSVDPTLTTCIDVVLFPAEHIHAHLSIIINGQPLTIPGNIGITATCIRPVHTHDDTGRIHMESPVVYPYTLHDFFLVWGLPFDSTQIAGHRVDSTHTLTMTVNGVSNTQYQDYVMHDSDQIVITYGPTG